MNYLSNYKYVVLATMALNFNSCSEAGFNSSASKIDKVTKKPTIESSDSLQHSPESETIVGSSDGDSFFASDECKGSQPKVTKQIVNFPESRGSCDDSSGGPDRLDQIKYEPKSLPLPAYSKICNISMRIPGTSFAYDDEFALTLNDVLLTSSYYPRPSGLKTLPKFDWTYLSSSKYQWRTGSIPYCASIDGDKKSEGRCLIPTAKGPTTIKKGALDVKLSESTSSTIMSGLSGGAQSELKMITFGNGVTVGSAGDCYHSAFDLEVEVSYLP